MKDLIKKVRKYISENETEYIIIGIICAILSGAVLAVVMINRSAFTPNETAAAQVSSIQPNTLYNIDIGKTWTGTTLPYVSSNTDQGINIGSFTVTTQNTAYSFTGNYMWIDRSYTSATSKNIEIRFHNGTTGQYTTNSTKTLTLFLSTGDKTLKVSSASRSAPGSSWYSYHYTSQEINNITISFSTAFTSPTDVVNNLLFSLIEAPIPSYNITGNITNGYLSESTLEPNTENFIQIIPNDGYTYPDTIHYTGSASDIQYFDETGEILITNPTSDFTITATCPQITIMKSGYYLVNPENIPSTDSSIAINFHIVNIHTSAQDFTGAEPLSTSESVTVYDSLNRWTGLYDGLYATSTDEPDTAYALWVVNPTTGKSSETMGNIIHLLEDQELHNELSDVLLYIGDNINTSQVFAYWAYPLVSSTSTISYSYGFEDGINQSIIGDTTTGVVRAIFDGLFGTIFKVEIFPGFPLYIFILIPLVFAILGIILWLIRGR